MIAVSLHDFGKRYKKKVAVEGLNLEVDQGSLYGLIGPDGAGKSSVLKSIAGVLSFENGTLDVFGKRIDSERAAEQIKSDLGFMPQGLGLNLYRDLSVEENIDFFARLRLVGDQHLARAKAELLEMTRLAAFRDRPMKNLSGGMKQKLGLVCALIHRPKLLILDEPTTGVDPVSRRDFWTILSAAVRDQGVTAIVSSAYMDEASRFDRVCLMHEGKVLAEGDPEQLSHRYSGTILSVVASPQLEAIDRLRRVFAGVDAMGGTLRIRAADQTFDEAESILRDSLSGLRIEELRQEEGDLEDAFISLVTRHHKPIPEPPMRIAVVPEHGIAIEARNLSKYYGDFAAADKVSFKVLQGQIFGLLGANGAGKTTVIKMLTGIMEPSRGQGQVAGADMRRATKQVKSSIGYVSQSYSLYQDLTVGENVLLYAGIYGLSRNEARERAKWVYGFAGLGGYESVRSGSLPLGLRQRLALGCALVHKPKVLFLDEPTSGVDPIGRRAIWEILYRLAREEGVAILITTHYMSEAEHCDQLALMHSGRIVASASPAEMKRAVSQEAGQILEIHSDAQEKAKRRLLAQGIDADFYGSHLHVFSPDPTSDEITIQRSLKDAGITGVHIDTQDLSLEDVFVYRIHKLEQEAEHREALTA